jgi:hypothetical protein
MFGSSWTNFRIIIFFSNIRLSLFLSLVSQRVGFLSPGGLREIQGNKCAVFLQKTGVVKYYEKKYKVLIKIELKNKIQFYGIIFVFPF